MIDSFYRADLAPRTELSRISSLPLFAKLITRQDAANSSSSFYQTAAQLSNFPLRNFIGLFLQAPRFIELYDVSIEYSIIFKGRNKRVSSGLFWNFSSFLRDKIARQACNISRSIIYAITRDFKLPMILSWRIKFLQSYVSTVVLLAAKLLNLAVGFPVPLSSLSSFHPHFLRGETIIGRPPTKHFH